MENQKRDPRSILLKYATFCLGRRPYFTEDLRQKLTLKAHTAKLGDVGETIDQIVDDIGKSGFLDDKYLACAFVRRELSKGHGSHYIIQKIRHFRLPDTLVKEALAAEATHENQLSSAQKVVKKYHKLDKMALFRKIYSRGFPRDVIDDLFDSNPYED